MSDKRKGSSEFGKGRKTPAIKKSKTLPAVAKAMPSYRKPSSKGR